MNRRLLPLLLILALLLAACGGKATPPAGQAAPTTVSPAQEQPANQPAANQPVAEADPSAPPEAAAPPTRGPGSFDFSTPERGLDQLPSYRAVLALTFEGTQNGQPYKLSRTYTQVVDRSQETRLLREDSIEEDGQPATFFAGLIGPVRYVQPALDGPCQASLAAEDPGPLLEPAQLLPALLGAEEAGQETVEGVPATLYTFDQRALGAGEQASASGKLWIAQDGGWVVKYELAMQSQAVFGEGISGEQRWSYAVSEVGQAQAALPEACPQPLADFPVPPGATGVARLPTSLQFHTTQGVEALDAFYNEQLPALGWAAHDKPPASEGVERWVFARQGSAGQVVALITAQAAEGGLRVRVYQVQTAITEAQ